jgi:sugar phosphate permease
MRRRTASKLVLALLCAMSFILYVDRVNLSTAAGPIQREFDLSNTELGVALSAFTWSYAVFQIVGGRISDRLGPRITLAVCAAIWTVCTVGTGFIGGLGSLFAVRLVLGIGEGATLPTSARAISNWTARADRGFVQGLTHSFSRLGNAVTPPIVAALVTWYSWRASFWILGGASAVWLVFWLIYFRDDPRTHPKITQAELDRLPDGGRHASVKPAAVPWGALLRRMAPTALVYFCYGWTGWLYFTWLPTFFLKGYNLDIKSSAFFASGVFFAGVVGDTLGGVVSDRLYKRTGSLVVARSRLIATVMILCLLSLLPVLFIRNLVVISLCLSLAFLFLEMIIGPIWAVPMDVAPDYAGTASGILNTGAAVAGILTPIAFGVIVDLTGNWTLPFAGSILLMLVGAVATVWIRPDRPLEVGPTLNAKTAMAKAA